MQKLETKFVTLIELKIYDATAIFQSKNINFKHIDWFGSDGAFVMLGSDSDVQRDNSDVSYYVWLEFITLVMLRT